MKDKELVRACLHGNAEMQTALYQRFASKMYGICLRYSRTRAEAEDILQQGFVKVFLNLNRFREGSLEGWIRKIMINEAISNYRKRKRDIIEIRESITEIQESDDASILSHLQTETLLGWITELPDGCRMVFNLFAIEGYSHAEIGELLKISEGNSRSQYHRARQLLKEKIKSENYEHGKREIPENL
jgi:RNA polymerase sigma factor (sigma-70 family)